MAIAQKKSYLKAGSRFGKKEILKFVGVIVFALFSVIVIIKADIDMAGILDMVKTYYTNLASWLKGSFDKIMQIVIWIIVGMLVILSVVFGYHMLMWTCGSGSDGGSDPSADMTGDEIDNDDYLI